MKLDILLEANRILSWEPCDSPSFFHEVASHQLVYLAPPDEMLWSLQHIKLDAYSPNIRLVLTRQICVGTPTKEERSSERILPIRLAAPFTWQLITRLLTQIIFKRKTSLERIEESV